SPCTMIYHYPINPCTSSSTSTSNTDWTCPPRACLTPSFHPNTNSTTNTTQGTNIPWCTSLSPTSASQFRVVIDRC
ncbi:hypothetical protein M9458_015935, partial [Cirrhinus mrigala]